jgi:hypothetical protein
MVNLAKKKRDIYIYIYIYIYKRPTRLLVLVLFKTLPKKRPTSTSVSNPSFHLSKTQTYVGLRETTGTNYYLGWILLVAGFVYSTQI